MQTAHEGPGTNAAPIDGGGPALAIIAAVAANAVIGVGNRLPWLLSDDLKHFRSLTTGHAVIMGRRTWESIGRPLPSRQNIVVTRQPGYRAPGAAVAASLEGALALVRFPEPAFCIGGGALYRDALPRAMTLHLTEIRRSFAGDASFPSFDRSAWRETARESRVQDGADGFEYAFVTYERSMS